MPLTSGLEKLRESLSCCTYNGSQHTEILITEEDTQAKLKKATIHMGGGDWFSFCPDKGRGKKKIMSPLLTCNERFNHHRACDCVIVICNSGNLDIIYIDLKSGNPVGYANQFKSTKQFVYYAVSLLREFNDEKLKVSRERFVILHGGDISIKKTPTTPLKKQSPGSTPDNALKFLITNGGHVYLKQILK